MDRTLRPLVIVAALLAAAALAGCAAVSAGPESRSTVVRSRTDPPLGPAPVTDDEGFTEAAYRALIEQLGAATDRLADEGSELDAGVRADLLLHMAVAYRGLAEYERVLDQQRYDAAMRACHERGRDDCHERVQPDFSRSDELEDTARTCVRMLQRLREHERTESRRDKLRSR